MSKQLDMKKSVYDLCMEYPELKQIMSDIGFTEITRKAALLTAGRVMTIPKGAEVKGIPMNRVLTVLRGCGFEIVNFEETSSEPTQPQTDTNARNELLKSYIQRLNNGEDLEQVRADFVEHFSDVEASEIMNAEQELIKNGTPLQEVQKLCDVHSALFHGATQEEKIANAEKAVEKSLKNKDSKEKAWKVDYSDKNQAAADLIAVEGHPLHILTLENQAVQTVVDEIKSKDTVNKTDLAKLRAVVIHYAKKGDLIYPMLKVRYGISGPSDVMWTVDDEIRDELSALSRLPEEDSDWHSRFKAAVKRVEEMIYKEANILFPICAKNFTHEEWIDIYHDLSGYDSCLVENVPSWDEAESQKPQAQKSELSTDKIVLPSGSFTLEQLDALLNTIPMEITFIDENNINRYFNDGWKLFKRPLSALGREVFSCHPPKIEPMVRAIIDDFKHNRRDSVPVWMEKAGEPVLVTYMAVRDGNKKYIGTVELVQKMGFAKEHFSK